MQAQREEATSANDDADTEDTAMPVNVLEAHGIGAADVKKLREAGYHTVQSVTFAPKKALIGLWWLCVGFKQMSGKLVPVNDFLARSGIFFYLTNPS